MIKALFRRLACPLLTLAMGMPAWTDDAGMTFQTTLSDSYRGTNSLDEVVLARRGVVQYANTDDLGKIRDILLQLRDGDVLVLAVHSNPTVVAVGKETLKWAHFWDGFGVQNPPKLAAVVIAGCMSQRDEEGGAERDVPATKEQVEAIRRSLGARALYLPRGAVHAVQGPLNALQIHASLLEGKKLADIQLGGGWQLALAPGWNPSGNFTLANLRSSFSGDWLFRGIKGQDCSIAETAEGDLELRTEKGASGTGRYGDDGHASIVVDFPFASGLKGTLSPDGTTITWSNGERWVRPAGR